MKIEKQAYKVKEFCEAYGIGRTMFYEEIKAGRIRIFKVGRLTLISRKAAEDWITLKESLPVGEP